MKLLNETFKSIEEIADFVKNNEDVRERWSLDDIVVTKDKQFQIRVYNNDDSYEDNFEIVKLSSNRYCGVLCANHIEYWIEKFNPEVNISMSEIQVYNISNAIVKIFESILLPGDMFVYDKPCDGMGGYDIYAIANVNGIIMAEFIRNSTKSHGSDEHEIGTKGLESLAMMEAWQKYMKGEGVMKHVEEYVNASIDFVI